MGRGGHVDNSDLESLHDRIVAAASSQQTDQFYTGLLNDLMNGLLSDVKNLTPVSSGHLRRNWNTTPARRIGQGYFSKIYNNVKYAQFVENGHRQKVGRYVPAIGKRLTQPFVEGHHMLREGMNDYANDAPAYIQEQQEAFLRQILGGSE